MRSSGCPCAETNAGDEHPGAAPADVVFILDEKSHPRFKVGLSGVGAC